MVCGRSRGRLSASCASSWKWVAKIARQRTVECSASSTAQAMARPSRVAVPRPISSTTTSERGPARLRMAAVSIISTMKVERPRARSSEAPTRLNSRSTTPMRADAAGTGSPAWARITASAVCRRKVDLPAMFGPVSSITRRSGERSQPFGVKAWARGSAACTTAWRQSRRQNSASSRISARHQPPAAASFAADCITSSSDSASASAGSAASDTAACTSSSQTCRSRAAARSCASLMRRSSDASSSVPKRARLAVPWRRVSPSRVASAWADSAAVAEAGASIT